MITICSSCGGLLEKPKRQEGREHFCQACQRKRSYEKQKVIRQTQTSNPYSRHIHDMTILYNQHQQVRNEIMNLIREYTDLSKAMNESLEVYKSLIIQRETHG